MLEESGGSSRSKDLGRSPDHRVAGPGHQHGTHGISTSCSKWLLVGVVASTAWSLGFFTLLTTWDKSQRRWKRRGSPWYHSKKPQSKVLTLCTRLEGIVQTHLPCSAQSRSLAQPPECLGEQPALGGDWLAGPGGIFGAAESGLPLMIRKWGEEECCEELLVADSNLWGADLG